MTTEMISNEAELSQAPSSQNASDPLFEKVERLKEQIGKKAVWTRKQILKLAEEVFNES